MSDYITTFRPRKERNAIRGQQETKEFCCGFTWTPSGTFSATTCTDKIACSIDFHTGELVAIMHGHSEVIAGIKFANDLKHVITVSANGCILVWQLPADVTSQIKGRLRELWKNAKGHKLVQVRPVHDAKFSIVGQPSNGWEFSCG